jgi:hypothetical protein
MAGTLITPSSRLEIQAYIQRLNQVRRHFLTDLSGQKGAAARALYPRQHWECVPANQPDRERR